MQFEEFVDVDAVARSAAGLIALAARDAVSRRGRFVVAVSGGRTPWSMLEYLANEDLPWAAIYIVQVDERIAPAGDRPAISSTLKKAWSMHRCRSDASIRCPSKRPIWPPRRGAIARRSKHWRVRRRRSI